MAKTVADTLRDLANELDAADDAIEEPDDFDKTISAFTWLAEVNIETFDGVFYGDTDATIITVVSRLLEFILNSTSTHYSDRLTEGFSRAFEWLLPELTDPQDYARWLAQAVKQGEGDKYVRRHMENLAYERSRLEDHITHISAFAETVKDVARSLRAVKRHRIRRGLL
jgi:hypothetical protein